LSGFARKAQPPVTDGERAAVTEVTTHGRERVPRTARHERTTATGHRARAQSVADGSENLPGQLAVPARPDDDELRVGGLLDQAPAGPVVRGDPPCCALVR
jgi:hypothetical protein